MMRVTHFLQLLMIASCCAAQTTPFPGNPITLGSLSASGSSFAYSGVLTGSVTLNLTASGQTCLQSGIYCTNPAGVVVVAGTSAIGQATSFSGTFGGTTGTWNYGSLLMSISGVGTVQLFPANPANGLGSGAPSTTLSVSGSTLSSLGFGAFSVTNPTVSFFLADNEYPDNSGGFTISGSFTASGTPTLGAPALSEGGMVMMALLLMTAAIVIMRREAPVSR
jgi:hypothetical protein